MNFLQPVRSVALCLAVSLAILPIAAQRADAQTLTWDGATNSNWSNNPADVNWSGSAWSPNATAWFAADEDGSVDYTITLTDDIVASNLRLYNLVGTDPNNDVKATLAGQHSLTINATGNLSLGPQASTSPTGETVLDMGGLDAFTFNGSTRIFRVGLHPGSGATHTTGTTVSTVTLADTNTIIASELYMGDQNASGGGGRSYLYLGRENTINANTISIGALTNHVRSTAYFQFADGLTDPSATFRATNGTSAVPNWNIGRVATSSTTTWTTTVDLGAGTIDARVANMLLGDGNINNNTNRAGIVNAFFTMGAGEMEVDTLGIGRVTGSGSLRADHDYSGNGTFNIVHADAEFTAGTINIATMNHTATGGTPTTTGLFHLADGIATVNGGIVLGSNTQGADANSAGVTATVSQSAGTLTISGGLLEGSNAGGEVSSNVELLGGTATINGGLSADRVLVGHEGRTAATTVESGAVRIGDGSGMGLLIGHRLHTALATTGILDLSDASSVTINTGTVAVAYNASTTSASASVSGTLTLSATGTNLITADLVRLGQIDLGSTGNTTGTLNLGADNTIHADTFIVGGDKSRGIVTIASGGTLDLGGKLGGATDLLIGANNNPTTGVSPTESHFNLSGGTLNATLNNLVIGQYVENPGAGGSGKGRFTMSEGTVTANSVVLADSLGSNPQNTTGIIDQRGGAIEVAGDLLGGAGVSTVRVAGGTMTVGGNMAINELVVGDNSLTAEFTADGENTTLSIGELTVGANSGSGTFTAGTGAAVEIGTAANATDLFIARKTTTDGLTGTVDLSQADSLVAHLDRLLMAYQTTSDSGDGNTATVKLAGTNEIYADHIVLGWVDSGATATTTATIELGQENTIHANILTVGGAKATGTVKFADGVSGGVLNLGTEAARVDLNIGHNAPAFTGRTATGHLDGSRGTINAWLDEVLIGFTNADGGGKGVGTLTLENGTIDANSILLGQSTKTTANDLGTIEMKGGTLRANSIAKGNGQAVFDWTGGTLSVDHFGFDLTQNGGTLAPGNSIGTTTIDGNYTMNTGELEIQIDGPESHDFVMVHGAATLAGELNVLLDGYLPALGTHFDVLQTTGDLNILGLALTSDWPGNTFGWWDIGAVPSGDGFLLRLSAVPEPSSVVLLMLGIAVLLGWRRRK